MKLSGHCQGHVDECLSPLEWTNKEMFVLLIPDLQDQGGLARGIQCRMGYVVFAHKDIWCMIYGNGPKVRIQQCVTQYFSFL